jgi:hypothetical protein
MRLRGWDELLARLLPDVVMVQGTKSLRDSPRSGGRSR